MSSDTPETEKITMANTKKEMLDAYNRLLKQLTEKRRAEMKPAEKVAQKKEAEARAVADSLSTESIGRQIGILKSEIGGMLNQLADRLEEETAKYVQVKKAAEAAEAELHEIYDIEKAASSLAALLEAQKQKREQFEEEMATEREVFESDMNYQRELWKTEKSQHEAEIKERNAAEQKQREREQEEFKYQFERQRQLTQEQYEHEKAKLEREIHVKREEMEKDLADRENAVATAEAELKQLREKVERHPGELNEAVARAVKEATERVERDGQNKIELLQKEYVGERNVLNARIEGLQATVEKQAQQIARLSEQLEHSYRQVQDIAVKAIEGSSVARSASQLRPSAAPDLSPRSPQGD
jgi:hypothetical protein